VKQLASKKTTSSTDVGVPASAGAVYAPQTAESLPGYLARTPGIGFRLGGSQDEWYVREVGDGNLNLVFIVTGPGGGLVVKQALPYLRCVGEGWPLTLDRAWFEYEALVEEAKHAERRVPAVYHFDRRMALLVMEYLRDHVILRKGLIAGKVYPLMAQHLGEFMADTLFKTSDLFVPAAQKKERMQVFCQNTQLCKITEDLVFTDPYYSAPHNRHTTPQLDSLATAFTQDSALKIAVQELKYAFLTRGEAMIHGDLHTGSIMVTESDTRVIDPEFAFFGPMGFDVGALLGNFLLAWCAQPGHAASAGERGDYQRWILEQVGKIWNVFSDRFAILWSERMRDGGGGDAFIPALCDREPDASLTALHGFLQHIWRDAVGFAGVKMIRRILGLAHVEDLESIRDVKIRAACEGRALRLARRMVLGRDDIRSLPDLLALVDGETQ
jgi:5-methylthioribose kinase